MLQMRRFYIAILLIVSLNTSSGFFLAFASGPVKGNRHSIKPAERILLYSDREVYIAGENLLFSMRLLSADKMNDLQLSKIAYLAIRNSNNKIVINAISKIEKGFSSGSIYLSDTLSSGLYQIIAYTNVMRNSDESFYFQKTIYIANRFDQKLNDFDESSDTKFQHSEAGKPDSISSSSINKTDSAKLPETETVRNDNPGISGLKISTNKYKYNNREKISAYLEFNSPDNDSIMHFSISVAESQSLRSIFVSDIYNANDKQLLNHESITSSLTSTDLKYQTSRTDSMIYLLENNGYILKGKVTDINKNETVPGIYVLLSMPDTILSLDYAITDDSGQFYFLLSDYYEGKKLILSIYGPGGKISGYKIEVEDKFTLHQPVPVKRGKLNPNLKDYISNSQEKVWIQKVYGTNQNLLGKNNVMSAPISLIFSKPQLVIYPADYTEFPDLIEMAKNIIPGLRLRKVNDTYTATLLGMDNDNKINASPAIFLDGVLIDDISKILNLGTDKIERIEMIKSAWFFGDIEFHGIVSIFSKKFEIERIQLPKSSLAINIGFYSKSTLNLSPDYSQSHTINREIPDMRQLIYWNPDVDIIPGKKKEIEFFSSDVSGKFLIKASGITSKGHVIESEYEITVVVN